MKTRYLDSRL